MNYLNRIINSVYSLVSLAASNYFHKNWTRLREVQLEILFKTLEQNSDTDFGIVYGFSDIKDIESYQAKVPIREYDQYRPWIDQLVAGEGQVLTKDRVRLFEPTGGSRGGSKLIPYTTHLKNEFQKAIKPWLNDIYRHFPEIQDGTSYWSITPVTYAERKTVGGIPIGFEDDTEYFGAVGRILSKTFAVPAEIRLVKDTNNFKYLTAYFLLCSKNLSFVSVWNPTYILLILESIDTYLDQLIYDIEQGQINLPVSENIAFLEKYIKKNIERADQIKSIFAESSRDRYVQVWPKLKLISCWLDGESAFYEDQIKQLFPNVFIQGKGLVSTEGIMTIPLMDKKGCVPAYTSHFLEFLEDGCQVPMLLDEVQPHKVYTVILTTGGGLYRYNTKDRVQIERIVDGIPIMKFVGRADVSDLVGEKLAESQVQRIVLGVQKKYDVKFLMLAPHRVGRVCRYVLYVEPNPFEKNIDFLGLRDYVDTDLRKNFHYRYAQEVRQLQELQIFKISKGGMDTYTNRCLQDGQRLGDIKPGLFDRRIDWFRRFEGTFVEEKILQ